MGIVKKLFNSTRKPEGLLGELMVKSMNKGHAAVSDWGMEHITKLHPSKIIDLGCGGGRNAAELLKRFPAATVHALDYSEVSVQKTKQFNQQAIKNGRLQVTHANVLNLPFSADTFDLATAFETVYFWPGPTDSFREVYRTLRPGGVFLIVNEVDGENPRDSRWLSVIDGMRIYNGDQLTRFLTKAGFSKVIVKRDAKRHWLCVLAIRDDAGYLGNT